MEVTQPQVTQSEVNVICDALLKQNEEITTRKVKALLGFGQFSVIADMVLQYKLKKFKKSTSVGIVNMPVQALEPSLNECIRNIIKTHFEGEIQDKALLSCTFALSALLDQNLHSKLSMIQKEKQAIMIESERLERENLRLHARCQHLLTVCQRLKQHLLMLQVSKKEITQLVSSETLKPIVVSTHLHQIECLKAQDYKWLAVYDAARDMIILKMICSLNYSLISVLKLGRKGLLNAVCQSKPGDFWEISNFKPVTFKFLKQNGFEFSDELHQRYIRLVQKYKEREN